MAVIGIDLGTTNSLAAIWRDGNCSLIPNLFSEFLTPSVISVDDNGDILIGKIAKERLISHPDRTVASFKRFMGTSKEYSLGDRVFRPEDLSSLVIRQLKTDAEAYLQEPVTEAIISVPAYFNDRQRTATKLAGKLAGIKVERIINEPSAASLAYLNSFCEDKLFLVFDFGGGTLDVSLVETFENIIDIIAISGDNHLGGDDINQAIADQFYKVHSGLREMLTLQEQASVLRLAEQCKIALSTSNISCMIGQFKGKQYQMSLDNNQLVEICAPLFGRIKNVLNKVLRDSNKSINEIDDIILVGGSSKMPIIRKYLTYLTGKEPKIKIDPDKAVAVGAGIVSGIKRREQMVKDIVLTDICPFTLGVEAFNPESNTLSFSPIIERNTSLPVSNTQIYQTIRNRQKTVNLRIYQGESYTVANNLLLGEISIQVPPAPAGMSEVNVRFTYDINGILEVEVTSLQTHETVRKVIVSNSNLTQPEIEQRLTELSTIKINPCENNENRLLLARGERLYEENYGEIREMIERQLLFFESVLEHKNILEIKKAQRSVSAFFDQLDSYEPGLQEGEFI